MGFKPIYTTIYFYLLFNGSARFYPHANLNMAENLIVRLEVAVDSVQTHRARNSNIFGSDKCYKLGLWESVEIIVSAWTHLRGVGWGSL